MYSHRAKQFKKAENIKDESGKFWWIVFKKSLHKHKMTGAPPLKQRHFWIKTTKLNSLKCTVCKERIKFRKNSVTIIISWLVNSFRINFCNEMLANLWKYEKTYAFLTNS
jgi:hypothetical protein